MFAKDFTVDYLKFTALESGTFTLTIGSSVNTTDLSYVEYSVDDGETWTKTDNVASTTVTVTTPTLSTGDSVLWRGSGTRFAASNSNTGVSYHAAFSSTGQCSVSGDINTLLGLDKPNSVTSVSYIYKGVFYGMSKLKDASDLNIPSTLSIYCCSYLFYNCTGLTSAPSLPTTTLANFCYRNMFYGCTSLTTAPSLPATTLASGCYQEMFYNCTSLTVAPSLPATTLTDNCYNSMFRGCSSLTTAPVLPATRINYGGCYYYMFYNCSSLNYVKALFITDITNTSSITYTSSWLYGVANVGTFVKNPLATWNVIGKDGIPTGWTSQYDTSVITEFNPQYAFTPAGYVTFSHSGTIYIGFVKKGTYHTVYISKNGTNWQELHDDDVFEISSNENCYFCGSLTSSQSSSNYTQFIVNGSFSVSGNCNSIWDYTNLSTTLRNYCGYNLFKDCKGLISASNFTLPSLTAANYCYYSMFYNCISLTAAPQLPATTLATNCYYQMFYNCTSLINPPTIGATKTSSYCFREMFYGCTSLVTPPTIPLTDYSLSQHSFREMFYGCTSLTSTSCINFSSITALATYALYAMFRECTSLTAAPTSIGTSSTTLGTYCFSYMFYGCTNIENVPSLPRATLTTYCYYYMFYRCSKITTAPELPAISLTSNCYSYMFRYCSLLNYVKALFTTTPSTSYTNTWLGDVASTGIFVKNINATWTTTGTSAVPTGWTIIYYDPSDEKYYTDQQKTQECDDHGNPI